MRIFWGDKPQVQSERDFLAQVEGDLLARLEAVILVNFYTRSGSRQVGFLIATNGHVCHVEFKKYEHALEGSPNGPWRSRRADGTTEVIDRQNPFIRRLAARWHSATTWHRWLRVRLAFRALLAGGGSSRSSTA